MIYLYWTQVWSSSCLVNAWFKFCSNCFYMDFSKMLHGFVKIVTWILQIVTCICQNRYNNFSKLIHGFVTVVPCIHISSFTKQNPAEVLPRFVWWSFCFKLRDGSQYQNGWFFGKCPNGLCPSPLHFWKIVFQFFHNGYKAFKSCRNHRQVGMRVR